MNLTGTLITKSIYHLLDIKPDSWKLYLLWLPPIYALWLYAIGKRILSIQSKSTSFFSIVASANVTTWTMLLIVHFGYPKEIWLTTFRTEGMLLTALVFTTWFLTIGLLSKITIDYERLENPDKYHGIVDIREYVGRFFSFFYWPLFIRRFQHTLNKLSERKKPATNTH